jgi:hypothetical protein
MHVSPSSFASESAVVRVHDVALLDANKNRNDGEIRCIVALGSTQTSRSDQRGKRVGKKKLPEGKGREGKKRGKQKGKRVVERLKGKDVSTR